MGQEKYVETKIVINVNIEGLDSSFLKQMD